MSKLSTKALLATVLTGLIATTTSAMAETQWQHNHPRRAEVNHRLNHQDQRIHREVREGEINRQQASQLHKEVHQIRQDERGMARQNGGHITKQEQRILNQQANVVSHKIGQ